MLSNDNLRKAKNIKIKSYKKGSSLRTIMIKSNIIFQKVNPDLGEGSFSTLCSDVGRVAPNKRNIPILKPMMKIKTTV